jgi:hypothetical protein
MQLPSLIMYHPINEHKSLPKTTRYVEGKSTSMIVNIVVMLSSYFYNQLLLYILLWIQSEVVH